MPADFLALNYRSDTTPQLRQYSNGVVNTYGNTFGVLDTGTDNSDLALNRLIRFYGQVNNDPYPWSSSTSVNTALYALVGTQVYRTFDEGNTWTSVFTLSPIAANNVFKSGLNIIYLNGQPALCLMWSNGAIFHGAYSFNGTNWTTESNTVNILTPDSAFSSDIVYINNLYAVCTVSGTSLLLSYAPGSGGSTTITARAVARITVSPAPLANAFPSLCVWQNRLFYLYSRSGGTDLAEVIGGSTFTVISGINTSTSATNHYGSLFVDQGAGFMIAIFYASTGFVAYSINTSFVASDITSTVLPSALTTTANTSRAVALIDPVSVSATPQIYIYFATSGAAAAWTPYRWTGTNSQLSLVLSSGSTVGSSSHALPFNRTTTGQYFWYSQASFSVITGRTFVNGTVILQIRLYGSFNNNNSFRAFFTKTPEFMIGLQGPYPRRPCTLSNPSGGIVLSNTIIFGNSGSPSGTPLTVTWEAETDGVTNGDLYQIVGETFFSSF